MYGRLAGRAARLVQRTGAAIIAAFLRRPRRDGLDANGPSRRPGAGLRGRWVQALSARHSLRDPISPPPGRRRLSLQLGRALPIRAKRRDPALGRHQHRHPGPEGGGSRARPSQRDARTAGGPAHRRSGPHVAALDRHHVGCGLQRDDHGRQSCVVAGLLAGRRASCWAGIS